MNNTEKITIIKNWSPRFKIKAMADSKEYYISLPMTICNHWEGYRSTYDEALDAAIKVLISRVSTTCRIIESEKKNRLP